MSEKDVREQLALFGEIAGELHNPLVSSQTIVDEERRKLIDHSWDYEGEDTKGYTHCFHSYPAMMIPQVAGRLIKMFSDREGYILDPFCGSGTVLVEAKLAGLNSYGIDINPLARLLSKVKTTPIDPHLLRSNFEVILKDISKVKLSSFPEFFNIDYWFKPSVIKKLATLKVVIEKIRDERIKDFFKVAFSETVREVSNTRNSEFKLYRLPKDKLEEFEPDVLGTFKNKVMRNIEGMKDLLRECKDCNNKVIVLDEDTREKTSLPEEIVQLVVTSPPYGDSRTTVAYGQFSRLSLQWLDFSGDSLNTDKKSLGGRRNRDHNGYNLNSPSLRNVLEAISERDGKRAKEVLLFYIDLDKCLKEISRVLRADGYVCMVIGNRMVKRVRIPTDDILVELAPAHNLAHLETITRSIPNKRMPLRNSPTNVKGELSDTMSQESIVILQKL